MTQTIEHPLFHGRRRFSDPLGVGRRHVGRTHAFVLALSFEISNFPLFPELARVVVTSSSAAVAAYVRL